MLEELLGTELIFWILQNFTDVHRGKRVDINNFSASVNQLGQNDYSWFFNQWLKRAKGPHFDFVSVKLITANQVYEIRGRILQSVPTYQLNTYLEVNYIDNTKEKFPINLVDKETEFSLSLSKRPMKIRLDSENKIFKWFPRSKMPMDFAQTFSLMKGDTIVSF